MKKILILFTLFILLFALAGCNNKTKDKCDDFLVHGEITIVSEILKDNGKRVNFIEVEYPCIPIHLQEDPNNVLLCKKTITYEKNILTGPFYKVKDSYFIELEICL